MRKVFKPLLFSGALYLSACATVPLAPIPSYLPAPPEVSVCENSTAKIFANHVTARLNECTVTGDSSFAFTIQPEDVRINPSAWYGFRVDPKTSGDLKVTLNYENGKHRYPPKISYDGTSWTPLPDSRVNKVSDDKAVINLEMRGGAFYVSAQEIFTPSAHDAWAEEQAKKTFVTESTIGASVEGYPITMLEVNEGGDTDKPYVVIVGRQHPPEVTGALALIPFADTVLGESDLAKEFRRKFNVLIVPMMNPDGVRHGHWRHNMNGVDLNRDWGPFTQPETQAVKGALERFKTGEDEVVLFLDFHSTWRNLLYTQTDDEVTNPAFFARDWLAAVDKRLDDDVYEFTREASPNSGKPVSKNYMWETYGIPAITFEVGDHTDRAGIKVAGQVFAEEMMTLLLNPKSTGE